MVPKTGRHSSGKSCGFFYKLESKSGSCKRDSNLEDSARIKSLHSYLVRYTTGKLIAIIRAIFAPVSTISIRGLQPIDRMQIVYYTESKF